MLPQLRRSRPYPAQDGLGHHDPAKLAIDDDVVVNQASSSAHPVSSASLRNALSGLNLPIRRARSNREETNPSEYSGHRGDPLGLLVVHQPNTASIDVIFVHGLGGTCRQTWCKNRDLSLFWPKEWLPYESGMSSARILSFGYNAHFSSTANKDNILNISDFAKDLLFSLKFATNEELPGPKLGSLPILFVAHSMGGLVVKKAMILGQGDDHYRDIVQAIKGVVFLSTPHRGTHHATILNGLLSASFGALSSKQYIAELRTKSQTLTDINEQFRNIAPRLSIVSMFETLPTIVGSMRMMVLREDSSVLGYPGEIAQPLNADHHDVCKYTSRQDPNYINLRNLLGKLVTDFQLNDKPEVLIDISDDLQDLERFLGPADGLFDDLDFFAEKRMDDSCEWVLQDPLFSTFTTPSLSNSGLLWCSGPPGFGKSVICAFVIKHLIDCEARMGFHFYRFGDHLKNDLTAMLSSLAFQIAALVPDYRRKLLRLFEQGLRPRGMTTRSLWQKLFLDTLFTTN